MENNLIKNSYEIHELASFSNLAMPVYEENQTVAYLPTFIQTDSSIKRLQSKIDVSMSELEQIILFMMIKQPSKQCVAEI
jgi:hypothetical protein